MACLLLSSLLYLLLKIRDKIFYKNDQEMIYLEHSKEVDNFLKVSFVRRGTLRKRDL
jgi:hypothetical protein